jgi:penicillin-binding protein 1C
MTAKLKAKKIRWFSIPVVLLFVSVWAIIFFLPKPLLLDGVSFSQAIYDNQRHLLRLTLSQDDKYRVYIPLRDIPQQLQDATLLQEDQYFYWHYGVNPLSLLKAGWQTYIHKSRRIGASTITMQLARIHLGVHSKTLQGKLRQMLYALQLEMHYSKKQILEAYLNLAPYGNNIEGVGAASIIYFAKPIQQLNLPEVLTLAVIPQNPLRRTPKQTSLKLIRNKLYTRWLAQHPADKNKQTLMALPLQMQDLHALPFLAPHFVNEVLPAEQRAVITTLDMRYQHLVETVTHNYLQRKKNLGVNNASILLIDTRDMGIKALVGSASFYNKSIGGQIDGALTKRSPGSTLKPFIYGLALDQGLIHPNTVLKDVPRSFGSYNPENFDYDFVGPIKAKDALVLSRNIPAIYLADQLKQPNLYDFLIMANITHLKAESYYGLALVLGGAELSMQELASLYAMLVNDGVWQPIRKRESDAIEPGRRLLSPEASYLVLKMLEETPRDENYLAIGGKKSPVAWKTGTSSGNRDAWSVGVFGPYVMVVWIGNFDNRGNPAFVGRTIAAPLLFELIDACNKQIGAVKAVEKNINELNLIKLPVCKASGMMPTRYCQDTELAWFIPGKSPITSDTIYREVAINKNTGLRTCKIDNNTRFEIYEFWPSDLLKIFRQAGMQRRVPPKYDESCGISMKLDNGIAPQMTSPQTELSYMVRTHDPVLTIPLAATTDADVDKLYWFINETMLGVTRKDQILMWAAKPGRFVVRVVDDHGRSDARNLEVKVV